MEYVMKRQTAQKVSSKWSSAQNHKVEADQCPDSEDHLVNAMGCFKNKTIKHKCKNRNYLCPSMALLLFPYPTS
jgi:hypothetical protein